MKEFIPSGEQGGSLFHFFLIRYRLSAMVGNFLEHYDNALFGLLAPFIAPLFFKGTDPVTALVLTYCILPLGLITRPFGSIFFGWIGDRIGRKYALFYSLSGTALVTMSMGLLPTYQEIGSHAPLFLAFGKMLQSFFVAGESSGGAIFILEHTPQKKRSFVSSCYDASSIGGILFASALITLFSTLGWLDQYWRLLFFAGGVTALFGLLLRWKTEDGPEFLHEKKTLPERIWPLLKEQKRTLLAIILVSGFSYTLYSLAFTLMTGYIPLITSATRTEIAKTNTLLLIIDFLLLPCFGYLASKFGKRRIMIAAAITSALTAIPLFSLLDQAQAGVIIAVRIIIVLCGVAFSAPYHAWALEQLPPRHRYRILSLGNALGSQLIGMPASAICLWLYQLLGWSWSPGLYLLITGSAASLALVSFSKSKVLQKTGTALIIEK